ncbi:glycosyltransferase [Cellvibrio japonicus]|uniref:Glycosyl transferase, putative, gt4J n=1 Tax=Cellvibrio japonicus (strain Ueda107) TaxID=498211 RepID=B3PJL0_CELJU|nr:glycosyltransferase [Cellvibrio japonicus]ACE83246.1 glycosyl transferase, putative, gt4J [Cellvibrio japonicus Ueda107]QEI11294.1 glycosyltransferase [Cellvibrio japonicus]QEI14868.1 glycosyltransferase [Cellvibrio japonicus]QEI18448.1 glycosyltransferase [Cellvibrio japonicus]
MRILAAPAFSNEKINPYNALLYRQLQRLGVEVVEYTHQRALREHYALAHFHWPDGYVNQPGLVKTLQRLLLLSLVVLVLKRRGSKLVWTVHNTAPHDAWRPRLSQLFMQWFSRRCDGLIFMSEANKASFYQRYQPAAHCQYAIIPHGHYRHCYPPAMAQQGAKTELQLDPARKVLLYIGMIKPYKNVDGLMQAFNRADLRDYQLVIAGNPDTPELRKQLQAMRGKRTHLFLHFIPDEALHRYLSAADLVILPYKAILNSGTLLLALSYDKPVIAPHMGAVADLQRELGSQWVYGYAGELNSHNLVQAVSALVRHARTGPCPLDALDWDKLALATLAFYQDVLARTPLVQAGADLKQEHP